MKRPTTLFFIAALLIVIAGLIQTARDPASFSGEWYSSQDQTLYLFEEGLIYCSKHPVALSENSFLSGAYVCSKESIYLFATGIHGLEREQELYLIRKEDCSFLCENKDGSGRIYFIRYPQ